jgi:malate dehydrogenase (quinone)
MLELMQRCFPKQYRGWENRLREMMPGYGVKLNENPELLAEVSASTAEALQLAATAQ